VLHVEHHGPTGSTSWPADPVVLLHGFTQSGAAWAPVVAALTAGTGPDGTTDTGPDDTRPDDTRPDGDPGLGGAGPHAVLTVDAPGHGRSSGISADLWATADLIVEAAGPGTYAGYSMGARMALHVAVAHPDAVRRLVVVSGTGGMDDPEEREDRRRSDEEVARRVERDGVPAFLRWWLDRPIFATLPVAAAALDSRRDNTAAGLAASLRMAGTGTQEPLWERLGAIDVPTLVVAGALDAAYVARAERLVDSIGPNAALAVIPDAGHTCHLEQPAAFNAVLSAWLDHPGGKPEVMPGAEDPKS
jgi:2-succinyl-6-hydroxy-2,4-cyclohexadiene-1-carboxylate synthase